MKFFLRNNQTRVNDLESLQLPLFEVRHGKYYNNMFVYIPIIILSMIGLGCYYSQVLPTHFLSLIVCIELFLAVILFFIIFWVMYGAKPESKGFVNISKDKFVFKIRNNRLTINVNELRQIVVLSDYYQDYMTRDNHLHSGRIRFKLVYKTNKAYTFESMLLNKKQFKSLQDLLGIFYKVNLVNELPYSNGSRPLLLELRTYEELQLIKNELGIQTDYF